MKPKSNYRHLQVARGPTKYCGRVTRNSEVMQMVQTAAFAEYALGRDSPNNPSLATPSAIDLSAPPPASQVIATGVASSRQTML